MSKKKERQVIACPECGCTQLIRDYNRAELVCTNCGLVVHERMIDHGPEWRAFDQEQREKRTRVGAPMTYMMHDHGLSTIIDWRDRDIYGRDLPPGRREEMQMLRKWQRRIRVSDATERNLAFALAELERVASQLGLPKNVREEAAVMYRSAVEARLIRGRSIEGVAAAALYAACRKHSIPRTLDEISQMSRASKKEIGRSYRFILRELAIKIPPTNAVDYIHRFVNDLTLPGVVQSKALEIIQAAEEHGLTSGRGPTGVAAAAIYIASTLLNYKRTQRDVANVAGVTEVTIRNRYKEFVEKLDFIIKV